ncbi:hypothetical protein ACFQH8_02665 [Halomicroarcula sp. GCM10025710]
MQWYNEPETWAATDDEVRMSVPADTDFWRLTRTDPVDDDAPSTTARSTATSPRR